jgi:DNA-3-methyladenine glycosylase II
MDSWNRLTHANLSRAARFLADEDEDLAAILERHGPPPLWARRPGFATLLRIILEQQVSLASARSTFERLRARVSPLTPQGLAALGQRGLRSLGVTRQKAGYCRGLAGTIVRGNLDMTRLSRMDDGAARAALTAVRGVGPWTADIYLLMALRRADIWPSGDLALAASARQIKRLRHPPSPERLAKLAEAWRPYRSVAARMLWQHYLAERAAESGTPRRVTPRGLDRVAGTAGDGA